MMPENVQQSEVIVNVLQYLYTCYQGLLQKYCEQDVCRTFG